MTEEAINSDMCEPESDDENLICDTCSCKLNKNERIDTKCGHHVYEKIINANCGCASDGRLYYLHFICEKTTNWIKIGVAEDLHKELNSLQEGNFRELVIFDKFMEFSCINASNYRKRQIMNYIKKTFNVEISDYQPEWFKLKGDFNLKSKLSMLDNIINYELKNFPYK